MILVDTSVWIDFLRGIRTPQTEKLQALLGVEVVAIGDLILAEVLQGIDSERDFERTRKLLETLVVVNLCGPDIAVKAARNFRALRSLGITVRKTVDTIIATWCMENKGALLHADRDFDAFSEHLGLTVVC